MPKRNPNRIYLNIDLPTYNRLKEYGKFDDTIDDVLRRLMDIVNQKQKQLKTKEI